MGQYKISYGNIGSGPVCQIQNSEENFFFDRLRSTLPLILQEYYEYLNTRCLRVTIQCILLQNIENNHLNIKLFSDAPITKEQIYNFFKHWDFFIKLERTKHNRLISVEIEGNDLVLEIYKEYSDAKKEKLDNQKKEIEAQVRQDMRPTALKWAGGIVTVSGAVGFAVGGPIGAFFSAGFGLAFGSVIGINAASESDLSAATKENISKYNNAQESSAYRLTVIPLRENELEPECKTKAKLPELVQTELFQESSSPRSKVTAK